MPETAALDALLEGLNEPQRQAVLHVDGPLLVLAGAGSGKTRVLTHRIAHLVGSGHAKASEILAITFTNKAANEMRERVEMLVGNRVRAMWVMTFHSACARILRADAHRLGYTRSFTIYDSADQRRLIKQCLDELDIDAKRFTPRAMQAQISDAKNKLRDAEAYRQIVGTYFEQTVADVYEEYERQLHRRNAMDFDDLLVRAVNVLELFQEVRDRYQAAFRYLLVDEYQDTNHAQYRLLQLLAGEHRNLMVVGDDDQSIYGFRGADIRNILDFEDDYPDAVTVRLEQNYRSTQMILDAANAVISNNRGRMGKELWTDVGEGDRIKIRECDDEHAEARFVVAEIERLADEGVSRNEVAVFYRTNAQSRVLEDMLTRAGVSFQVVGGTKFYERSEVKDALAYLTWLVNPADGGAFTRVVNVPRRGIGQTSLGRVLAHANTMGISAWEAASDPEAVPGPRQGGDQGLPPLHEHHAAPAGAPRGRAAGGDVPEGGAERVGLPRRAGGRADDRGAGPHREPRVADGGRAGVRRARGGAERRVVPAGAGAVRAGRRPDRRGGARHADDDPQREGARVPDRVHDRRRGRRLPAQPLDRGGGRRGGAPARLRRPHPRDARPLRHLRAAPHAVRRRVDAGDAQPLPRRDPARADGRARARSRRPGVGRSRLMTSWASAQAAAPQQTETAVFRMGDDVIHAAFGDGVVTGVDAGGVVVVRFANDGTERRLMADYAPIRKR